MGKNDDQLWDDSALIDAFEDAISSYKMMHKMKQIDLLKKDDDAEDEDVITEMIETIGGDTKTKSHGEMVATNDIDLSNSEIETISLMEEKEVDEDLSNGKVEQEAVEGYSNAQSDADYQLLVNQYYELQEKLQTTWQQLQQFGYTSDQYPNNTAEVGLSDGTGKEEALRVPSSDAPHATPQPFAACCCCPCTAMCMLDSSCPENICKLCPDLVPGIGSEKSLVEEDCEIVGVAVRAAEKAISSIKIQTSGRGEGNGKISMDSKNNNSENSGCETDISTVLNAWFSAGLTTGKYLAEQSNARRKTDST